MTLGGGSHPQGPPQPIPMMASKHRERQREGRHHPELARVISPHLLMAVTLSHGASRCQRGWGWWPLPEQPGAQLEVRDPKKKERMDVGSLLGVVSAAGVTCTWVMDTEGTAETGDRT